MNYKDFITFFFLRVAKHLRKFIFRESLDWGHHKILEGEKEKQGKTEKTVQFEEFSYLDFQRCHDIKASWWKTTIQGASESALIYIT